MRTSVFIKSVLAAAAVAAPMLATAESNVQTGAGALTATAHVDFQITIPKFLFVRVGTGTGTATGGWATLGTVDLITWAPTAAQIGTGSLAGTGGDLGGGVETAVVVGNSGNVTFSGQTTGPLNDGAAGDTISYSNICITAAANTTATTLAHPGNTVGLCSVLADGATVTKTLTAVGKIVQQDAKWTYAYTNNTIPPAGTYGGINTQGGRVTYTASVP
jgi:hypothetical protein